MCKYIGINLVLDNVVIKYYFDLQILFFFNVTGKYIRNTMLHLEDSSNFYTSRDLLSIHENLRN